jgi:hypothetical protein
MDALEVCSWKETLDSLEVDQSHAMFGFQLQPCSLTRNNDNKYPGMQNSLDRHVSVGGQR